jgi:hypothetical protein
MKLQNKQDLQNVLNEIENLSTNESFIKDVIKWLPKFNISVEEWEQNKMPILVYFASKVVLK